MLAILAADATGPVSEARRQFFFSLTSAVASAVLAVTYAALFRRLGLGPRASLLWAAGGIFCTPNWFFGTSTVDDVASARPPWSWRSRLARGSRQLHPRVGAVAAGLALGLAFHCKEPLGIFILPVMAALYKPGASWRSQWGRLAIVPAMLAGAVAAYKGYDWYKFPPGSTAGHAALLKYYVPVWSNDPLFGLVALAISPAAGVLFYYPPVLIGIAGFRSWYRSERLFCLSLCAAIAVFVLFICSLTFFKGDTSWGPRYLTPVFAVLWIMAPAGSRQMRTWMVVALLATGSLVQLEALSIDPRRLYMEHGLPSWFYVAVPESLLPPSHLPPAQSPPRDPRCALGQRRHGRLLLIRSTPLIPVLHDRLGRQPPDPLSPHVHGARLFPPHPRHVSTLVVVGQPARPWRQVTARGRQADGDPPDPPLGDGPHPDDTWRRRPRPSSARRRPSGWWAIGSEP